MSGAPSRPTADSTPARAGTMTAVMPSASASSHACNGPAPPNATSARPRGSTPRSTVTVRNRLLHRRVRPRRRRPRRSTPRRAERGARRVDVEEAEPGKRGVGWDAAEHEIGIGDGRLVAAAPVARRARHRTGALRDRRRARRRDRCGRSSRRRRRWCARRATATGSESRRPSAAGRGSGTRAAHETDVGRRAAHVERDRVGEAVRAAATAAAASTPPAGPDSSSAAGTLGRVGHRHEPAGRGHHEHVVREIRQARR